MKGVNIMKGVDIVEGVDILEGVDITLHHKQVATAYGYLSAVTSVKAILDPTCNNSCVHTATCTEITTGKNDT